MTLSEALTKLSAADRAEVEAKLRGLAEQSALGNQALINFHSETRLPDIWPEMLKTLLACPPDPVAIKGAVTQCFRRWTLRGPALPQPRPEVYGRAVSRDRLSTLLFKQQKYGSKQSARRAVRNMLSKERDVVVGRWRNFDLGQYHMWATYNSTPGALGPFDGMPRSAEDIGGLLGLNRSERDQPLVLMEYGLPDQVLPQFPTIADAYSGDGWPYFFRPAPGEVPHGLTMPWPEYESHEVGPRPEVVHHVIPGAQLTARLKEVL
ncbi:MAG TPA: hypothetical protein VJH03_10670 [Blastocatellia bacterium]|nr:hypothetical protein [Blastocatellia bacterium]